MNKKTNGVGRREFLVAAATAGLAGAAGAATVGSADRKPAHAKAGDATRTVHKGLGGGKVLALSNHTPTQMLGTVFVSPSGKVAVVDGGYFGDGPHLTEVLRSLGGRVDFWLITHAHCDHYGALATILEKPDCAGLSIGRICHAFPDKTWTDKAEPDTAKNTARFAAALARHGEIPIVRLAKGQVYTLEADWTFEVLNDVQTELKYPNINDTSICFTARTAGRSWLVTGDVGVQTGRFLVKDLGPRLRHEFVFMAHHGQQGAEKSFYAAVAPKTALWPTPDWLWDNDIGKGPGSGPFKTNYTKCWMQELGVKEHYVLTRDTLFE